VVAITYPKIVIKIDSVFTQSEKNPILAWDIRTDIRTTGHSDDRPMRDASHGEIKLSCASEGTGLASSEENCKVEACLLHFNQIHILHSPESNLIFCFACNTFAAEEHATIRVVNK